MAATPILHSFHPNSSVASHVTETLAKHNYQVVGLIARGGYSECFLIYSNKYNMSFVCKVIKISNSGTNALKQSFDNEVAALTNIIHPNIIKVYETITTPTHCYLILEYCEGGNLEEYITKNGPLLSDKKLTNSLMMMLDALEYLESNNIAHCDIKPNNFLIDKHGKIKLTDFGLTKILDSDVSISKCFLGTLPFLPPEIILKKPFNPLRADIWSFGITVYLLSTGMFPFDTTTIITLKSGIMRGTITFPKYINPIAQHVITGCLCLDPAQRTTFHDLKNYIQSKLIVNPMIKSAQYFGKKPQILFPKLLGSKSQSYFRATKNSINYL